jgi:hypothetical protein
VAVAAVAAEVVPTDFALVDIPQLAQDAHATDGGVAEEGLRMPSGAISQTLELAAADASEADDSCCRKQSEQSDRVGFEMLHK